MTTLFEGKQESCALCGRLFVFGELVWSGRRQAFVCQDCLAEEESCGCADD